MPLPRGISYHGGNISSIEKSCYMRRYSVATRIKEIRGILSRQVKKVLSVSNLSLGGPKHEALEALDFCFCGNNRRRRKLWLG